MKIKCIGCYNLVRDEIKVFNPASWKPYKLKGDILTIYKCPRYFEGGTTLGGLLRPSKRILEAVSKCSEDPLSHCVLCSKPVDVTYGYPPVVGACTEHNAAWSKWLDDHPDKREYISPHRRVVDAHWIEVFREFIEDMRQQGDKIGE